MNKITLLLIIILSYNKIYLQIDYPFPDSNAIWINMEHTGGSQPSTIETWSIGGSDTIINSNTYKIIHYGNDPNWKRGGIRSSQGLVYYIPFPYSTEYLLYDFNLNVGDTINNVYVEDPGHDPYATFPAPITNLYQLVVDYTDSILINGNYRKQIHLASGSMLSSGSWIEGIGNTQGLFWSTDDNISNFSLELYCMSYNDTILYPNSSFGTCESFFGINDEKNSTFNSLVSPNPSSNLIKIQYNNPNRSQFALDIYDNLGRKVNRSNFIIDEEIEIDVRDFKNGIYHYTLFCATQNLRSTGKFIKN
jgi:hypothetical protein